jgi:cell division protease FtsH
MVKSYGMGGDELGSVVFAEKSRGFAGMEFHEKEFSEATAEKIDNAVRALVEKSEQEAARILTEKADLLEKISQDLLKKETISREEFLAYFE